ncbi:glycosyltransferase family 2 protein [Aeromonas salmonicida]|uniref:glycosyltransferase family 2 protein n=1 Tax=Aeromonas salmonicida TaxID=645 RepID=UPI000F776CA4|nr:glycosyltransferase family 2 protein [Aeromonas salmonicida]RSM28303.1 hypothetical protein C5B76_06640 [Aeromonas salmonicida]
MTKLVSVIVPMYNVEKYIEYCVNSIINQTYPNLEILLIDDGSPDGSGDIADRLSCVDHRIKVMHTENKGVSQARNFGISISSGDYLVFVDGDDYLEPNFVEYMIGLAIQSGAEFVMSKNCNLFPGHINKDVRFDTVEHWSPEKASAELLHPGKIEIGCWNKLFSREFIEKNKIIFPNKYYMGEGLHFIVSAAQKAQFICVGERSVYNYRKDNQQSATTVVNIPKYINALAAIDDISSGIFLKSDILDLAFLYHKYMTMYIALHTIYITENANAYSDEVEFYKRYLRRYLYKFLNGEFAIAVKIKAVMFAINPKFACEILKKVKAIIR